jgi:hypothetical protein
MGGQEERERVRLTGIEVSLAHDLDVPEARTDRVFPHCPVDPLDETGGEEQCDHPERDGEDAYETPPSLTENVAEGEPEIHAQRFDDREPGDAG